MTVYPDAVRLEVKADRPSRWINYLEDPRPKKQFIGWFRDEVAAISAAFEFSLIRSAILPELRRLPEVVIQCEYRSVPSGKPTRKYSRGTQTRLGPLGRRIVRRPGALAHDWLR